jgi:glucarate dehydratase
MLDPREVLSGSTRIVAGQGRGTRGCSVRVALACDLTARAEICVVADPNVICRLSATVVNVPSLRPCAWSGGVASGCTRTLIEVETRDGLVGLGEAPGDAPARLIENRIGTRIRGRSALDRSGIRDICIGGHRDFGSLHDPVSTFAFAGIEIALWDILAKRLGIPLYVALGGAVRERAPFGAYAYTVDLSQGYTEADVPGLMAGVARTSIADTGARIFEFKIGRHSLQCDIETTLEVRQAIGPDVLIGVDANMALTVDRARAFIEATRDARLSNIEEPVATLAGMEQLRRDYGIPVSCHCTDFDALRGFPSIDSAVGDLHADGGIAANLVLAELATRFGRRYWLRSCQELGVAFAAFCHLGMACREISRPAQTLINWVEHPLTRGARWCVRDGGVTPPDTPGLGVELDRAALAEYHQRYRNEGPLTYYDRR